jgi:Tfp pilus assembly protein PilO
MKSIAERLERRERRNLAGLGLLLVLALVFFILGGLGQKRGYSRSQESLASLRADARTAEDARYAAKAEWRRWDQARLDLVTLHKDFFYHQDEGISKLRLDLQKLFNSLSLNTADVKFDYVDYEKDKAQKVSVTFTFTGSYALLRRFLFAVEEFSRLLFVERITFVSIDPASGLLNLKIAVAAYYDL